jgi:hypothetical protein
MIYASREGGSAGTLARGALHEDSRASTVRPIFFAHQGAESLKRTNRELVDLLSQLATVIGCLEPNWARAFLKRTQFGDASFVGFFRMFQSAALKKCGSLAKLLLPFRFCPRLCGPGRPYRSFSTR